MTEKDRCITNIYFLAKKKNILIRDLEKSCDVSVGYLARLRQDKKQSLPGSRPPLPQAPPLTHGFSPWTRASPRR